MPVPLCFFCGGNARYELVITAPRVIAEHEGMICPNCRDLRAEDEILVFEIVEADPGCGNPVLQPGIWLTGRWASVDATTFVPWFPLSIQATVLQKGYACVNADSYAKLKLPEIQRRIQQ